MTSIVRGGQADKSLIRSVHPAAPNHMHRVAVGPPGENAQVKVQLIKTDGVVRGIEVHCACGEKLTIELQYE